MMLSGLLKTRVGSDAGWISRKRPHGSKNSCPLIRRVNGFPRLEWKNLQLRDVRGGDDEALKKR